MCIFSTQVSKYCTDIVSYFWILWPFSERKRKKLNFIHQKSIKKTDTYTGLLELVIIRILTFFICNLLSLTLYFQRISKHLKFSTENGIYRRHKLDKIKNNSRPMIFKLSQNVSNWCSRIYAKNGDTARPFLYLFKMLNKGGHSHPPLVNGGLIFEAPRSLFQLVKI